MKIEGTSIKAGGPAEFLYRNSADGLFFQQRKRLEGKLREKPSVEVENAVTARYGRSKLLRWGRETPIVPISFVKAKAPMGKKRSVQKYTPEGSKEIHKNLDMIACPKHFALNCIEDLRFYVDVKCDDRTLYEVYLPHFKKCVDAGALSIMGAYNRYDEYYCCANKKLLTDILREGWGFDGFVMSDFIWDCRDTEGCLRAGVDVEMMKRSNDPDTEDLISFSEYKSLCLILTRCQKKTIIRLLTHRQI